MIYLFHAHIQDADSTLFISFLTFKAEDDSSFSLAFNRKESNPPFLSTLLNAEADILNLKLRPKASETRLTLLRLGKNFRFVLFFA